MVNRRSLKRRSARRYGATNRERPRLFEKLEDRLMLASAWQNPVDALDVSGDRHISPIDALLVINEINVRGSRAQPGLSGEGPPLFVDVSGDGFCSPIDALLVINALNGKRGSPYTLRESTSLGSEQAVRIRLGQDHGSRLYRFAIEACFDRSDTSGAPRDRLEVYLVDAASAAGTLLDGGQPGTPLFVMAEDAVSYPREYVRFDGAQVTVDLTCLADLAEGEFRFELVNADDDSGSQVIVVPLSNDVVDGVLVTTFPPLPGDGQQLVTVQADWLRGTGGFEEIGFVVFDDESGSVDGVAPDSFAYSQAVRESASRRMLFSHAQGPSDQCILSYSSGARLGLYVFAENLAMALPEDHLRVRSIGPSSWEIGWEDTPAIWPGLQTVGDRGYDDAIFRVVATIEEDACGFDPRNWTFGESGGSPAGKGSANLTQCTATLTEGDSFEVRLSRTFTVPDDHTAMRFSFDPLQFDVSDAQGMNDAFEAALLDAQGRSLVHVFTSARDAFFNISEDLPAQFGAATSFGDGQVTLDLSGVPAGTEATLVLRLVNNDEDTQTNVRLTEFEVLAGAGAGGTISAPLTVPDYPRTPELDFAAVSDVTASVSLWYGRSSFDAARGTLFTDAALVQQGNFVADVPLLLVIDNVSDPSVVPSGFDGRTPAGLPYYEFTSLVPGTTFDWGEQTQSRAIAFLNPTGVQFTFDPIVLVQLNRGPHIVSQPASEVLVGLTYMYDAHAVDPDDDTLTYELLSAPVGMTIAAETGFIQWRPRVEDLGSHSVVLRVADGRGGVDEQHYALVVREDVPNRPPLFTSEPAVDAVVAAYFERVDIPVGDQPAAVAVGDFTGQGPLSLVTANPGNQTVSVAVGQGSTSFDRNVDWGIGDPPPDVWRGFYEPLPVSVGFADPTRFNHDVVGIARGDFNHDGFLDLATSTNENRYSADQRSYVVVTLGNGDGTFQPPTKILLPVAPTAGSLLARDFDRDGELDLIAVSGADSQVYFLRGQGDGSFADPVAAGTTPAGPQTALAADLNGDDILDLVINCPGRDEMAVLPGLGDGTFDTAVVLSTGDNPMSFSLTDVDNSGSVDLVIGCYHSLRYEVRLNDGTGQFGEPIITSFDFRDIVAGTGPGAPTGFYAADFDEDGFVDLAGDSLGGWFVFFRGDGSGSFKAAIAVENPTGRLFRYFTDNDLPDFNGDGRPDLLFAKGMDYDNNFTIALNHGDGTFDFQYWTASAGPEITAPGYQLVGALYYAATFGDFNNDGVIDLVSGSQSINNMSGGMSLLLGESATVFSGVEWLIDLNDAGGQIGGDGMITGDFTNDGLMDLLYFTSTFSVREGRGDGSFGPPQWALPNIVGHTNPVRTADFDGDGTLDVVFVGLGGVFGNYDSGFHVALGLGDGTFSYYSRHVTPTGGPYDLRVQDFNEDGLPDVLVSSHGYLYGTYYPRLELWLNNPDEPATFTQVWTQSLGQSGSTAALLAEDVTGDGHQDVICQVTGRGEPNRLYVFPGQGDGSVADPIITHPDTIWFGTFTSGDLNADGNLDLVAVSAWAHFYVMLGRSDGTFEDPVHYSPGRGLSNMVVADMDRDGILDLVAETVEGPMIYRGKGDGSFFTPQRYAQTATSGGTSIDVADFDRDGMLDVATWSGHAGASDGMHVYRSLKPGLQAVATIDLNADGQLDILAANARNGHVTPLIGHGDNTFTRQADILAGLGTVALAVGDLTADGHSDFITANEFVNTVSVFINDGVGNFLRADLATGENPVAVAMGDVNRDTRQDFVVANQDDSTLSLFIQQEDGGFLRSDIPTGSAPEDLELVDLNGDGRLDIAVTIPQADNILVHFGSDDGTFADVLVIPAGLTPNHVATGDLNADGRPDLVVSYPNDNKIGILYGQGADRVTRPQMMEVGQQPTDLVLEDCDGDGRVDIVVLNSDGNDATVLFNRFDPAKVYTYQPAAEDPDGDAITFALLDGPGGMLLDPATGAISWAPNSDQYGEHPVTIEASDGRGGAATQSYVIAAGLPRDNQAPLILTEPQTTVPGRLPYAYPIRAVDPDGDPLHTQLVTAPDGMSFDPYSQQVDWDVRGTALVFEGFHRVDVPDDASLHAANLTLEHWVRFDEETTSRRELLRKTVGSWESFDVYYENNALFVRAGNLGTATAMAIPFTPEVGRWYHLAVTFDDDNDVYAIYVDGNQAQSATTELSLGYDASWIRIGGRDNDAFLRGAMDEIRIWSVARTPEEICHNMRRALQGDEHGLVLYYPADEGHGTILHDQSGHGNDGLMGEPNSFPPRWETSFGLGRTESVTVRVRDVWGAVTEQVFDLTVSADVPASVEGILFDDQNADGVFQVETETGLGGREIFVDRNRNGVREPDEPAATTDETGGYSMGDLVPGDHRLTLLGQVGWRPTAPAEGVIDVSVGAGETAVVDFGSTQEDATAADRSPAFVSSAPIAAEVGDLYRYAPVVSNPDGRPVVFALSVAPPGMAVDPATGTVGWIPAASQTGSQLVLLRVRDDRGLVDIQGFTIEVGAANTPPVFASQPPEGPAAVGLPFFYHARALDADGDALFYNMINAPTGMVLDPETGTLSWTPTADQIGQRTITISAGDGRGGEDMQTIALTVEMDPVNRPPVIHSTPRDRIRLGDMYRYELTVLDPDGDPLEFSLMTAPAGMLIDSSGVVTWVSQSEQIGDNAVSVQVSDGRGGAALQDFSVEVRTQMDNQAPVITSRPSERATLGQPYVVDVQAADPDGDPLRFLLDEQPAGMVIDAKTGALRWTPTNDQLGPTTVSIRVMDPFGGEATQSYVVNVRGTNTPPLITTSPPTEAAVGETYVYVVGVGAAEGDILTFSLPDAPAGMSLDAQAGVIDWTPEVDQLGTHSVTLQVANEWGGACSQTFEVLVQDGLPNRPPAVTSSPPLVATVDQLYQYPLAATDPEADAIEFGLRQSPVGMVIDAASGLLAWTPTDVQVGEHVVTIAVLDAAGAAGLQSFTLTVQPANTAPQIISDPRTQGTAGAVYRYDVVALDDEHDPLSFQLIEAPAGMTVDVLGRITWRSTAEDLGTHDVTVQVSDGRGGEDTQSFQVTLEVDQQAPRLTIFPLVGAAYPGGSFLVQVRATDNVGITHLELTVNGDAVPMDSYGIATFPSVGSVEGDWMYLVAAAADAAGNIGTTSTRLRVIPTDGVGIPDQPDIAITSPAADATVTTFTDVIGTAYAMDFSEYRLLVRPADGVTFEEIARGTTPVHDGKLGTFDPTLLANDSYVLRLEVFDQFGSSTFVEQNIGVRGELKLGNFQLSFNDLSIPVSGIPITVARTYDSLLADREGDFGYGWRMEFRNADLRVSVQPSGMEDFGLYTPFRNGTRVYVTLPGGRREGFTFTPEIHGLFDLIYFTPKFTPDPGVTSRLTVQNAYLVNKAGEYFTVGGQPYNPVGMEFGGGYTLTTKDGTVFRIGAGSGQLHTVTDRNQNRLTFSDSGIVSSTGKEITFERDAQGRITAVVDPLGNRVQYAYDAAGDLVSVTDREGNVTRFVYDAPRDHYLSQVIDPLERTGVRAEYNEQGRLKQAFDAAGSVVEVVHDTANSIETVIDQLGNSRFREYDERGNVVAETNALGEVTRRTFDADDNMLTRTDALGHTTTYTYDGHGNLLTETDPLGNTLRRTYNALGQVLNRTDPLGNTVSNTYDAKGNLLSTEGGPNGRITLTHDANGQVLSSTNAAGTRTFQHDASGNLIRQVDALGNAIEFTYDANGRSLSQTVTVTASSGSHVLVTRMEYDTEGRGTRTIDPAGGVSEFQYDPLGNTVATIDPLGRVTRFQYDDRGQLVATVYADDTPTDESDNPRTRVEYDEAGRVRMQIDESGHATQFVYDALGRCVTTIFPDDTPDDLSDNPRFHTEFDAAGREVATIDERGIRTEFKYDVAGQRIEMVLNDTTPADSSDNPRVRSEFDAAGRQIATIDPLGHRTEYVYDGAGLLQQTRYADGTFVSNTYDDRGQLIASTDQAGYTTCYEYDANNQLVAVVDALNQRTEYAYNQLGNLVRLTDANTHVTQYEYNDLTRLHSSKLPLGQESATLSDAAGNTVSKTDFNGDTTVFEYDARDRLTTKRYPDGTSVQFTYTRTGQCASVTDSRGVTTFQYDARDRLLSRTDPDGREISYTYDLVGNRTSVTTPAGTTQYTFDARNQLETVTDPQGNVTQYQYDAAGSLTRTELPNGTVETRQYDALNRLTLLETSGPNGRINSFQYTLDPSGHRIGVVEQTGRQVNYTQDALYRLIGEQIAHPEEGERHITYTYDAVGNRLVRDDSLEGTTAYGYDENDRLLTETLAADVTRYTYDNNGNVLSKVHSATDQVFFDWDYDSRLIAADVTEGGVTKHVEYQYDPDGIRVAQFVDGHETRFLVDRMQSMAQVAEEYTPGGDIQVSYVYGLDLISQYRLATDGISYYHVDGLGSTRALSDALGVLTDSYVYDAFGRIIQQTGTTTNSYLFAGEQRDAVLGWDYLRARYHDPALGRFSGRDSFAGLVSDPVTLNRYLYANADPVNTIDPSGHFGLVSYVVWGSIAVYGVYYLLSSVYVAHPGANLSTGPLPLRLAAAAESAGQDSRYRDQLLGFEGNCSAVEKYIRSYFLDNGKWDDLEIEFVRVNVYGLADAAGYIRAHHALGVRAKGAKFFDPDFIIDPIPGAHGGQGITGELTAKSILRYALWLRQKQAIYGPVVSISMIDERATMEIHEGEGRNMELLGMSPPFHGEQ